MAANVFLLTDKSVNWLLVTHLRCLPGVVWLWRPLSPSGGTAARSAGCPRPRWRRGRRRARGHESLRTPRSSSSSSSATPGRCRALRSPTLRSWSPWRRWTDRVAAVHSASTEGCHNWWGRSAEEESWPGRSSLPCQWARWETDPRGSGCGGPWRERRQVTTGKTWTRTDTVWIWNRKWDSWLLFCRYFHN